MSLKAIIDAVEAQLLDAGVDGITFAFGREHVSELASGSRVVWVPRGGPGSAAVKGGTNPRSLRTRNVSVEAHVWGFDPSGEADHYAVTESLFNSVAAAVHRAAHGSYSYDSETWPEMNGELLAFGRVVIVGFTFQIPITDTAVATTTPTALTQDAIFTVPTP